MTVETEIILNSLLQFPSTWVKFGKSECRLQIYMIFL